MPQKRKKAAPRRPAAKKPSPPGKRPAKLTARQKRFVEEYCLDWNGSRAARKAGYSAKTSGRQAIELLQKPHIAAAVEARRSRIAERIDLTEAEIAHRLALLAGANMLDYVEWGPRGVTLKDSGALSREQGFCVLEVSETRGPASKITFKLVDKTGPLRDLARYKGLFTNKDIDPAAALRDLAQILGLDLDAMPEIEA